MALLVTSILVTASAVGEISEPDLVKPLNIVVFGGSSSLSHGGAGEPYPDQLQGELLLRGIAATVTNESVKGSHSGSRLDDDTIQVAHAMDRFTARIVQRGQRAPDFVVIDFGLEDAMTGTNPLQSRISPELYQQNLEAFIDRIRDRRGQPILITPGPVVSTEDNQEFVKAVNSYAEICRQVASQYQVPCVDRHHHISNMAELTVEDPGDWITHDHLPGQKVHDFLADRLASELAGIINLVQRDESEAAAPRTYTIPLIDLAPETSRQVIVDRESGQYLGHPTTCLLEDNKTMLCVYPKGHGRGGIVYKRSGDGGLTWSDRLPVPENWATSKEVPTLHRVIDAEGTKRIIMWSGLYPARLAVSEDDGMSWSPLNPVGDWGGIVVMGCLFKQNLGDGRYMAMFHDDGRFFTSGGSRSGVFTLFKTFTEDGGLTWSYPEAVYAGSFAHLCEPGVIRSPDGRTLAVLLRENARRLNSHVIFSHDEGLTWSVPRQLPASLTGDRHTGVYTRDGRLFISFRDTTLESPTKGDWVGWVGTFDDIINGGEGQYRVRLMDNHKGGDCAYPGVEILPDDTIVTTTYGHWIPDESPYIVSVRLKLSELDEKAAGQSGNK